MEDYTNGLTRHYKAIYELPVGTLFKTKDGVAAVLVVMTGVYDSKWEAITVLTGKLIKESIRIGVYTTGFTKQEELLSVAYLC